MDRNRIFSPTRLARVFAASIGLAKPVVMFWRVIFAVATLLALAALLGSDLRHAAWRRLLAVATRPIGQLAIATLCAWTISSAMSAFPLRSLEATTRAGAFVALAVMTCFALRRDVRLHDLAMRWLIVFSGLTAVISILSMTALPELYWLLRLKGLLSTRLLTELKAFSSLSVCLVPLLVFAAMRTRGAWSAGAWLAAAGMLWLTWETYNRAAMAGFLGMGLAMVTPWLVRYGTKRLVFSAAGAIVVIIVWLKASRSAAIKVAPAADWLFPVWLIDFQRQTIWMHVLKIAEKAPWFGIGANSINFTAGTNQPLPGNEALHIIPGHLHNWSMEVLAETGGIGLLLLLATVIAMMLALMRDYRRTGNAGLMAAIAIMAGYWISGLFNFSYWSAWWQLSFMFSIAICLGIDVAPPSAGRRGA